MHNQKVNSLMSIVKISDLVLVTFAIAFFPRVVTAMGVPSVINFVHFLFIPILCVLSLVKIQAKIWNQISKKIFLGLFILLVHLFASAFLNSAGVFNVILSFCLLNEPFVLLLAMISIPMSAVSLKQLRFWIMLFAFIHLIFVYFQFYVLSIDNADDIKGVFLNQGGGHHVGGAVALTAGVYFFATFKSLSIWLRTLVAIAFAADIIFSDSKQVAVVFVVSSIVLMFTKLKSVREAVQYLAIVIGIVGFTFLAGQIFFSGSLQYWGTSEKFSGGFEAKFSVFSIIKSYYHSPLNWLFGLGPGHSIGRLGWLIPDYIDYLQPLGITTNPATEAILAENEVNPFTNKYYGSSMWSLTFSWAGFWGDLGFLGLGVYLYLWFLVWRKLCLDDISKFFLLNILIFGGIFSWMEEPGYVLFVASLIGIQWQEYQLKQKVIVPKLSMKKHIFKTKQAS